MFEFLRRWFFAEDHQDPVPRASRLLPLLADYPPYLTPFPGVTEALSLEQCEANLQYLLDERQHRLSIAADLLGHFGIDLRAGMRADDPTAFLAELDRWARSEWPALHTPTFSVKPNVWLRLPKDGLHIELAMLMDIAIVLGETVVGHRSEYSWQLDLDPKHADMTSYRRVVVAKSTHDSIQLDFEYKCINSFDAFARRIPASYPLGFGALAASTGQYDPVEKPVGPVRESTGPHVYDKAKYHDNSLVSDYGFDPDTAVEQSRVPTAFFYGWLAKQGFLNVDPHDLVDYLARRETAVRLYEDFAECLIDWMLTDEGNAFARHYFHWHADGFFEDLTATLAADLPSEFHIIYTFEGQDRIDTVIDRRYTQWRNNQP